MLLHCITVNSFLGHSRLKLEQGYRMYRACPLNKTTRFIGALAIVLTHAFVQPTTVKGVQQPVTELEATILKIEGGAITGAKAIPAGRTLTAVHLSTSDPQTSFGDGFSFGGAQPGFRVRGGATVPAVPAEQVTFRINGTVVATSVPDMRATLLQTDAGPVTAVAFTASGSTYAIPRTEFSTATRTVAPSFRNGNSITTLFTYQYGLLPVGAMPRLGVAFTETSTGSLIHGSGTELFTVFDTDDIRGNSDSFAEELVVPGVPALSYGRILNVQGIEILALVRLNDGTLLEVTGLRYTRTGAYGYVENTWLFDQAALSASGATIDDISEVVLDTPSDHDLTWQELGFVLE